MRYAALSILTLLMLAPSAAADLTCQNCGRLISGTYYYTPSGKNYCEACWEANTACVQCGELARPAIDIDGHKYCRECYAKFERCGLCNRPLTGNYMVYAELNLRVCPACEREKPHCSRCGVPSNDPVQFVTATLCRRCLEQVEMCHSCGQPLMGDFLFFEGDKSRKFCVECSRRFPECDNCGAPSGPSGSRLDDGRYLCYDCRRISLFDDGLIKPIRQKVISFVAGVMNMTINHNITYEIKDRETIKSKTRNIDGDLNGLFYRRGDRFYVYVLYGLREKDLISVYAHEIGHAWQAENCPDDMPLEDQEGFAQWVAYKALIHFGYPDFAELLKEGDNAYSRGLVKMLDIEKTGGVPAVFNHIKRIKTKTS